jgi:hypothetical protein
LIVEHEPVTTSGEIVTGKNPEHVRDPGGPLVPIAELCATSETTEGVQPVTTEGMGWPQLAGAEGTKVPVCVTAQTTSGLAGHSVGCPLHPGHTCIVHTVFPDASVDIRLQSVFGAAPFQRNWTWHDWPVGTGLVSESSTAPSQFQSQLPLGAALV